jgi:hypothetical protein
MLAFASLIGESLSSRGFDDGPGGRGERRPLDHPASAKRVIFLFMNGGMSQVDTFDPKPMLEKVPRPAAARREVATERKTGALMKSPFTFKKYGTVGH